MFTYLLYIGWRLLLTNNQWSEGYEGHSDSTCSQKEVESKVQNSSCFYHYWFKGSYFNEGGRMHSFAGLWSECPRLQTFHVFPRIDNPLCMLWSIMHTLACMMVCCYVMSFSPSFLYTDMINWRDLTFLFLDKHLHVVVVRTKWVHKWELHHHLFCANWEYLKECAMQRLRSYTKIFKLGEESIQRLRVMIGREALETFLMRKGAGKVMLVHCTPQFLWDCFSKEGKHTTWKWSQG